MMVVTEKLKVVENLDGERTMKDNAVGQQGYIGMYPFCASYLVWH